MKIEPHRDGALRIWMTAYEMKRWGMCREGALVDTWLRLVNVARGHTPFLRTGRVLVERIPLYGGCLVLVTPLLLTGVYTFDDEEAVLQLGRALNSVPAETLPNASLYRDGDRYRLIVYGSLPLVSEFAVPCGEGTLAASYVKEHGAPMILKEALRCLRASCGSR